MRLLTVGNRYPPWSLGGYENLWRDAVRSWRAAGHQVAVLTTRPDPSDLCPTPDAQALDARRALRWYWHEGAFPDRSLRSTVALERDNAAVLAATLHELRPDAVVWFAMGGMSLSLLEHVRRAGVPALGVVGDEWMRYGPRVDGWQRRFLGPRRALAPIGERLAGVPAAVELSRAARWVFISEHLRRSAGLPGVVAHPGVDPARFPFSARPPEWRGRLLYLGRIDPRKGVRTAVEAVGALPDVTLRLDGSGDRALVDELREMAAGAGAGERITVDRSPPDAVPGVLAACDALLFPVQWAEPWGLVPLEAMATGRPVVASAAGGGSAEYLRDETNCLLVPPGDACALRRAVARLAGDPALRARLVAGGRATAARFTAAAFHERLEAELSSVTCSASATRRR